MRRGCSGFGRVWQEFWLICELEPAEKLDQCSSVTTFSGRRLVALLTLVLVAILLDASDAKARHSAAVDRTLPAREFLEAERVTLAGFVDAEQSARHCCNDFGLPANDPAGRGRRRQRIERQRLAERSDNLGRTNLLVLEHPVTPA